VDPPADDAARCIQYTSNEEDQSQPAPITEDRVQGKRPMAVGSSPTEALPAETSQAPKRRRLMRITNDEEEEDEAAPSLVRRPRSRPDVVPIDAGRVTSDPPAPHNEPTRLGGQRRQRRLVRPGGVSSRRCTGALTYKFCNLSFCTSSYLFFCEF